MKLKITPSGFNGLFVLEPTVYEDDRGYFMEAYNKEDFLQAGIHLDFVQDNQSKSTYGVVRGLHFQIPPHSQSKLIRVLTGTILDVVVDLRRNEATFGKAFSLELSGENRKQLFVPKGFAHGFSVLSKNAEVMYKCDEYYKPEYERGINHNDPELKIDWGLQPTQMIISEKDKALPMMSVMGHAFETVH